MTPPPSESDPRSDRLRKAPLLAQLPTVIAKSGQRSLARINVVSGPDRGRDFPLTTRETHIGRAVDNQVVLADISVSRHHVIVRFDGNHYTIEDLGSGNGTFVNGVPIGGNVILRNADLIELGDTHVRFVQPDAPALRAESAPPADLATPVPPILRLPLAPFPLNAAPSAEIAEEPERAPAHTRSERRAGRNLFAGVTERAASADARLRRRLLVVALAVGAVAIVGTTIGLATSSGHRVATSVAETRPAAPAPTIVVRTQTVAVPIITPIPVPMPQAPPPKVEPLVVATATPVPPARERAKPSPLKLALASRPKPKAAAPAPKPTPAKPRTQVAGTQLAIRPVPPSRAAAIERSAASLYTQKRFDDAVESLRTAAAAATDRSLTDRLSARARDYAMVGINLTRGDNAAAQSPVLAMSAYSDALAADLRAGKAVYAPYLRSQLGKIAPRAATVHLAAGRLEQARAACEVAASYGTGGDSQVQRVRGQLELKARDLFTRGQELLRQQPEQAKMLWRRVMRIVPDESVWYERADAALSKAGMDTVDL